MIKLILLGGIAGAAAVIGATGVSRVQNRLRLLRELKHDMKTIESLLVEQSMTLRDALSCAAAAGISAYRLLAERISRSSDTAEKTVDESGMIEELTKAELAPRDIKLLREYFIRLCESISAGEIALVTTRYSSELGRVIAEIEQHELGRAKVLRTVWMLAGLGIVIILI